VRDIETAGICTSCHTDEYFSHRGEAGLTGRFALIAGVPED
jgi:copper oxidase (laccase) domain-containing protein